MKYHDGAKTSFIFLMIFFFLPGCDALLFDTPAYWAASYFGQTSPYPRGSANPEKIVYEYSLSRAVLQTCAGGFLLGGSIRTFEETDAMLFKLDRLGMVEHGWSVHGGWQPYEDRQMGIFTRTAEVPGGYVAAGWANRTSWLDVIKGNTVMWVLRLDYAGKVVWSNGYGLTSFAADAGHGELFMNGVLNALVPTAGGGMLIAGEHLVMLNAAGGIAWAKSTTSGVTQDVRVTSDCGFIMVMNDEGTGANRIVKIDAAGTEQWSREYTAPRGTAVLTAIEPIAGAGGDRGYFIGGKLLYEEYRSSDWLLAAIDTAGNLLWDRALNGRPYEPSRMLFSDEEVASLVAAGEGACIAGGPSESFNSELNNDDSILLKIDAAGTILWQKAYRFAGVRLTSLAATRGGFVFTGWLGLGGDWQSLVVSCDPDGEVPGHGPGLVIDPVSFMVEKPGGASSPVSGPAFRNAALVTSKIDVTMRALTTVRVER